MRIVRSARCTAYRAWFSIAVLFLVASGNADAIQLETFETIAGPVSGEQGTALAVDSQRNLFSAGSHSGLDTDGDGRIDRPADSVDPMWVKSDPNGVPQWIATATAPGYHTAGQIAVDRAGGLYAVGSVHAPQLKLGSRAVISNTGDRNAYLIRIAATGKLLWTRSAQGPKTQRFADVASDSKGNVFVVGHSAGQMRLEGHDDIARQMQSYAFLAAWNADGESIGRVQWPLAGNDWRLTHIAISKTDDLWVVGELVKGAVDLDGDGKAELRSANRQQFVGQVSLDGRVGAFWTLAAAEGEQRAGVSVSDLVFASDGDILLGGNLSGRVDLTGDGSVDVATQGLVAYLARFDPSGGLQGIDTFQGGFVQAVATDGDRVALVGHYENPIDFNQSGAIDVGDRLASNPDGKDDIFALLVDGEGNFVEHLTVVGDGSDKAGAVAFAAPGQFWITGYYRLDAQFDPKQGAGGAGRAECHEYGDIFWARYKEDYILQAAMDVDAKVVRLTWRGARGKQVELYRNGERIATLANTGTHDDGVDAASISSDPQTYRVCDQGTQRCSNDASSMVQ